MNLKTLPLKISIFVAISLISAFSWASPTIETRAPALANNVSIAVHGNTRTRTGYITHLVQDCLKREDADNKISTDEIRTCVMNSKLFSEATVHLKEDNIINVEVKERWTLIPIPLIQSSGDYTSYGLFVMESNLLGAGIKLFTGASFSTQGNSFFLMLKNPSVRFTPWGMSLLMMKVYDDIDSEYKNTVYENLSGKARAVRPGISYRLTPELTASTGISYFDTEFEVNDSGNFTSYNSLLHEIKLTYKDADFKFYFEEGTKGYMEYMYEFTRSDNSSYVFKWEAAIEWEKNLISKNALQVGLRYEATNAEDSGRALHLGQDRGYRGIQSKSLWATESVALALDYQIPIAIRSYGTWTVAPFMDAGWFNPVHELGADTYHSYGAGIYLYLKEIAIPGLGLVIGQNDDFLGGFVMFTLGFSVN